MYKQKSNMLWAAGGHKRVNSSPVAKIVGLEELKTFFPEKPKGRVVLVGGCFDVLHVGHMRFLTEAKKMGDLLVVLLESDGRVKRLKGEKRPVFIQEERGEMLSGLRSIDLVVLLPTMERDSDYLDLVMEIRPDIIAVTENDPQIEKKRSQAERIGGELKVIPFIKTFSTSELTRILGIEP